MKKTMAILMTTLATTSVFAKPTERSPAYKVHCTVNSTFGEKCELINRTFTVHRNINASYLEHFQPSDSRDAFIFQVLYTEDNDKFNILIQDQNEQIQASTGEEEPKVMNLSFGTPDAGLHAVCTFEPAQPKNLKK